jgi:hypothetical protein
MKATLAVRKIHRIRADGLQKDLDILMPHVFRIAKSGLSAEIDGEICKALAKHYTFNWMSRRYRRRSEKLWLVQLIERLGEAWNQQHSN